MSAPISDDGNDSEQSRYAPPRFREQPPMPTAKQFYVPSVSTVPSDVDQDRRTRSEFDSWPERISEPSGEDKAMTLVGRIVAVVSFTTLVVLATIFAKPLWQGSGARLNADLQTSQAVKPSDRLTANNAPANSALVPATTIGVGSRAEPSASAPAQQASLGQEPGGARTAVRGVTDTEILFGISAPFSGAAKELGRMKLGIEAAFSEVNAGGGVHGRKLRLIAADDGYEPVRTAETMKKLYEKDRVFGIVGNVGTPTAVVAVPYSLERKMLFFGAFTGAGLLRNDPPDRYVFNYRASYAEETAATVHYLVKVRRLKPEQIAVFAQQDSYGDSGFVGVEKAIRSLREATRALFCGSIISATPWTWTRPSRNSRPSNKKRTASQ